MIYLGIDPGKSGGIAAIETGFTPQELTQETVKLSETPADVIKWLDFCAVSPAGPHLTKAYIESVNAGVWGSGKGGQRMGVTSAFSFGKSYGWLLGVLDALRIPYEFVTPQKWQAAMGCRTGGDKNVSKAAAQRLWPHLKITHANADCLLIAEYGRRLEARQ